MRIATLEPVVDRITTRIDRFVSEPHVWLELSARNDRIESESDLGHRIVEVFAEDAGAIELLQMDVHLDVVRTLASVRPDPACLTAPPPDSAFRKETI